MAGYAKRRQVTLPINHCEDDADWIEQQLLRLPTKYQLQARASYTDIYKETYDAEPSEHRRTNKARSAANTRLRLFVKRVEEVKHWAAQEQLSTNTSKFSGF